MVPTLIEDSWLCCHAGILNGGVLSTLLDCHGNWTAAIALMDRSCLPKPPLTLTASMLVRTQHKQLQQARSMPEQQLIHQALAVTAVLRLAKCLLKPSFALRQMYSPVTVYVHLSS
jgi:hypothetical protein